MTSLFLFSFDEGEEIRRTDWFDRHLMIRFPARRSKCENSLKICSFRQKHHLCTARHLCMSSPPPFFLDVQCYYYSISNVFGSTHFQSGDIASCTFTFLALLQHPKFLPLHNGRAADIISPHVEPFAEAELLMYVPHTKRDPSRDTLLRDLLFFLLLESLWSTIRRDIQ